MVTPEGGYVVAQPDVYVHNILHSYISCLFQLTISTSLFRASWQKQVSRPKGLTESDIRDRPSKEPAIVCPIDNKIFRDAVKTPCCETTYCEECIQTHLLEKDFICPHCATKIASLDKLSQDKPKRAKVAEYIEKEIELSKKVEEEGATGTPGQSGVSVPDIFHTNIISLLTL